MLPFAVLFSVHSYRKECILVFSHQSQFHGYLDALKSTDLGAFSLLGILPGIFISACGNVRLLRLNTNLPAAFG